MCWVCEKNMAAEPNQKLVSNRLKRTDDERGAGVA